jgi:hypothetical protein
MATYPHDQFDDVPADLARVGAHRAPAPSGRGWITFAWAALATGLLVAVGVVGITLIGGTGDADLGTTTAESTASSTPTPSSVVALTDPADIDEDRDISISILDGTSFTGLGEQVYDALNDEGWPVEAAAEADKNDTETTIVYYTDAANEDIALGLVEALGVGETRLREDAQLGASLRILVGADYEALTSEG